MNHDKLEDQRTDYVVVAAKGALGAVPFVGSLLAELAGTFIPNQRIDRITQFAAILEKRIAALEQGSFATRASTPTGADLLEEGMRQAATSLSEERRAYIASLIATGLTSDGVTDQESKHLLRILGELSDVEIVWLRFYAHETMTGDDEFRETHASILEVEPAHMSSPQSVHDKNSLSKSYKQHLARLGLLQERHAIDQKTKLPKIDGQGRLEIKGYALTSLGRLLLRSIGLPDGLGG